MNVVIVKFKEKLSKLESDNYIHAGNEVKIRLLKFSPIWELKFTNISLGSKINASY